MTCVARSRCSSHFHSTSCPFFAKLDFFFAPPTCFSTIPIACVSFASSSLVCITSARKNEYAFKADLNGAISSSSSSLAFPTHKAVIEALKTLKFAHKLSNTRTRDIVGKLRKFCTKWYTSSNISWSSTRVGSFSVSSKHTRSTDSLDSSNSKSLSRSMRYEFSLLPLFFLPSSPKNASSFSNKEAKFVGTSNSPFIVVVAFFSQ
mmetsp:Transcript_188/g.552  ORF Transcript_188/g.552 Transcript_188/m.552 type:complete len:205 (+) Transcript_188:3651-4265(+)